MGALLRGAEGVFKHSQTHFLGEESAWGRLPFDPSSPPGYNDQEKAPRLLFCKETTP